MLRHERIGVRAKLIENNLPVWQRAVEESPPERFPQDMSGWKLGGRQTYTAKVALYYYLLDDVAAAAKWAERAIFEADRYFFGKWRQSMPDRPDRPKEAGYGAKGGGGWMDEFRTATAFAAALGHWDMVRRLSAFPEDPRDNRFMIDAA